MGCVVGREQGREEVGAYYWDINIILYAYDGGEGAITIVIS